MMFKQLDLENFGAFSEKQSIDFRVLRSSGAPKPIILLGGKNGTGKTTLLEAVKICLYGASFKGRKMPRWKYHKHLRQRLHRNVDGSRPSQASVSLEFDYARAGYVDSFQIQRLWRFTDSDVIETLEIRQNDEPLKDVNEEQWQDFLMELIPPGLSRLFFFDGEKIQMLARGYGENQSIVSSMNSLLGIDLVEHLLYDIKVYCARKSTPYEGDLSTRITELEKTKKSLLERSDSHLQLKASLRSKIERVKSEIERQERQISAEGGGFASKREQLRNEAKKLDETIEMVKEEIRGFSSNLLPFACIPQLCRDLKTRLEHEEKEEQRQAALAYLNETLDDLGTEISQTSYFDSLQLTPEQRQRISRETMNALKNKIESINGSSKEIIHPFSSTERNETLRWIEMSLTQVSSRFREISDRLRKLQEEKERIEGFLYRAPSDDVLQPMFVKLGTLHEELGMLQQQYETLELEGAAIRNEQLLLTRELSKELDEKASYAKVSSRVKLAARTQLVLGEYLRRLREEKLDEFRLNFMKCLDSLFGKKDFVRSIDIEPSSFDITLIGPKGIKIPKTELSAGERQVYAIALLWALARTSGRQLPFIIDTPLGRLDTEHRTNIIKNFLPNASNQVIVLSTNTEIDQFHLDELNPSISKSYLLEYDAESGETHAKEGYFWKAKEEVLVNELQ